MLLSLIRGWLYATGNRLGTTIQAEAAFCDKRQQIQLGVRISEQKPREEDSPTSRRGRFSLPPNPHSKSKSGNA